MASYPKKEQALALQTAQEAGSVFHESLLEFFKKRLGANDVFSPLFKTGRAHVEIVHTYGAASETESFIVIGGRRFPQTVLSDLLAAV